MWVGAFKRIRAVTVSESVGRNGMLQNRKELPQSEMALWRPRTESLNSKLILSYLNNHFVELLYSTSQVVFTMISFGAAVAAGKH